MSGIGHLAPGLLAKSTTSKVPLLVFLLAAETNDLLYFAFTGIGLEKPATTTMDFNQGVRYLNSRVSSLVTRAFHVSRLVGGSGSDCLSFLARSSSKPPARNGGF